MEGSSTGDPLRTAGGRWLARIAAVLLLVVQLPVLADEAWDPSQSDFANYLIPAVALTRGGELGDLYERDYFAGGMKQAGLAGLGSFVPHPPSNALWLWPFASLSPAAAKAGWTVTLLLSLVGTAIALTRITSGSPALALVIILAPTLAIRNSLAFGQPYVVLGALVACGVWAMERKKEFLGGALLGLGVSFKPYALLIGLLFVDRARLRPLIGFVCGAVAPVALVLLTASGHPFTDFFEKVVPWMLRGDIQDPFAVGWGSLSAMLNRLLRFEPDLNPDPWVHAPLLARSLIAAGTAAILATGVLCGRLALQRGRPLDAVGIVLGFGLAASPFAASYQMLLLVTTVLAVSTRLRGASLGRWLLAWAFVGSPLVNLFPLATGPFTPLAYLRWVFLLGLAIVAARPFLSLRFSRPVLAVGAVAAVFSLPWGGNEEMWPRLEAARGYSMERPHFCDENLRWWSPAADGRSLIAHGAGSNCEPLTGPSPVSSRFRDGSWNLYLRTGDVETRITFSDANEVDPVLTPDGCSVVFASDQGRGLGSTALYKLDLSALVDGCPRELSGRPPAVARE